MNSMPALRINDLLVAEQPHRNHLLQAQITVSSNSKFQPSFQVFVKAEFGTCRMTWQRGQLQYTPLHSMTH
jgi:hypothetical protein